MARKEVDLVLSGSGVNFCAHVGAVRALYDTDFSIRRLVGVSGGAIVGAFVSLFHPNIGQVERIALGLELSRYIDSTFVVSALFKGHLYSCKKLDRYLRSIFGDRTLNDLPIPLTTIAADVEKKRQVTFSSDTRVHDGPTRLVFDAVRASFAAPTVFPPHLGLFDGGLVNNIPMDFAVEAGLAEPDHLIGVRVVPKTKTAHHRPRNKDGWKPKLIKIIAASVDTFISALDREHVEEHVDKVVFVPCPNSSFDFDIPIELRWYHFYTGYVRMLRHLVQRYPDLSEPLTRRLRAAEELQAFHYRRWQKYLADEEAESEEDFWH